MSELTNKTSIEMSAGLLLWYVQITVT